MDLHVQMNGMFNVQSERKDQEIILQPKQCSMIMRTHSPKQSNDDRKKAITEVGGFFFIKLYLPQFYPRVTCNKIIKLVLD